MHNRRTTQQPLIVAVCGDSGSGKTTLTDGMVQVFGQERIVHICLDDYHTLDRATRLRTGITALHPDANDFVLMTDQLGRLARGESVVKPVYDHKTGTFTAPEEIHPADIIVRFSRGSLYYRTRDQAHLDARLFQAKHAPKIDLTGVLDVSQDGCRPALRFVKGTYSGAKGDVLEIDGTIAHQKACELEDCIWAYMQEVSHLRPDRLNLLGRFYVGNVQRQSDPLALTQLIILYHVMSARKRMQQGEYLMRPQLKSID